MLKFNLAVLISMLLISFSRKRMQWDGKRSKYPITCRPFWMMTDAIKISKPVVRSVIYRMKPVYPINRFILLPERHQSKTLIYFNGGGACWNGATCLTSLTVPVTQTTRPAYNPSIENENNPEELGGILDFTRADNPLKDWNMVFIPSCTGDAHLGSKTKSMSILQESSIMVMPFSCSIAVLTTLWRCENG